MTFSYKKRLLKLELAGARKERISDESGYKESFNLFYCQQFDSF